MTAKRKVRSTDIAEATDTKPNKVGRPTAYKPEFVEQATKLCAMGATDAEMAEFFKVSTVTFYAWLKMHPEFLNAIQLSKDAHDNRVERSLYQKAIGYDRTVEKATASGAVVTVKEFFPPDTASAIFWLKNRRSKKWRDRHEQDVNVNLTLASQFETLLSEVRGGKPQIELEAQPLTIEHDPLTPAQEE
jgi:hypothetical protein